MVLDTASGWLLLVLVGLAVGILSSGLGVGGGIIVIPALVLLLACPQKSAQGMSLAFMIPMALFGVYQYSRMPSVHLQWLPIVLLIIGSLAGVLVGVRIMSRIPDLWLQRAFAILLIIVATRMLLWPAQANRAAKSAADTPTAGTVAPEKETSP